MNVNPYVNTNSRTALILPIKPWLTEPVEMLVRVILINIVGSKYKISECIFLTMARIWYDANHAHVWNTFNKKKTHTHMHALKKNIKNESIFFPGLSFYSFLYASLNRYIKLCRYIFDTYYCFETIFVGRSIANANMFHHIFWQRIMYVKCQYKSNICTMYAILCAHKGVTDALFLIQQHRHYTILTDDIK